MYNSLAIWYFFRRYHLLHKKEKKEEKEIQDHP